MRSFLVLASLCLSPSETNNISLHRRQTLQRIQRLHLRTPAPAVHFLSGSLPAPGLLNMHQYILLHMVALLGSGNILHQHGLYMLHHHVQHSWFVKLRQISTHYSLPDPLLVLTSPPTKLKFKSTVETAIRHFWHTTLAAQADSLPSLKYLRTSFLSLGTGPQPPWWTCVSSPSAARAATVQAEMLSGRYRSCWLWRHWTAESGACRLPGCGLSPGDVSHLLSGQCPALQDILATTLRQLEDMLSPHPYLFPPVLAALRDEACTTFHLYPSTIPEVFVLCQQLSQKQVLVPLFRACRAWIWAVHRSRMKFLGLERYLQ